MPEHALYVTLDHAVDIINAIRKQANNGTDNFKRMSLDALRQMLGGNIVRKDIGNGLEWVVLKQTLETTVLSKERTAKVGKPGYAAVPKPSKGNGKKPSAKPTGW